MGYYFFKMSAKIRILVLQANLQLHIIVNFISVSYRTVFEVVFLGPSHAEKRGSLPYIARYSLGPTV